MVRLETDRPLARIEVRELVLECGDRRRVHRVEGAMLRGRAEADQHPIQAERGNLVADALFRIRRRRADRFSKRLKSGALVRTYGRQIRLDGNDRGLAHTCAECVPSTSEKSPTA